MGVGVQQIVPEKVAGKEAVRTAVIVERRYLSHPQPAGMISSLKAMGHSVLVVDPEDGVFEAGDNRWTRGIDIAVARGRSWGVLCLLDWLERQGVATINRRSAIAAVHNKAEMTIALAAAGVPTPRTWFGVPQQVAAELGPEDFPVIVKPVFGDNCRGLQLIHSREQLAHLVWREPLAIVQKFIPGCDSDLKLYCIGREVWAVRKPSPLSRSSKHAPALIPLTMACCKIAERCREVFGLELFGVDCIETAQGPLVIEVNEFPNYSAVPGADETLSNYILTCTGQERTI